MVSHPMIPNEIQSLITKLEKLAELSPSLQKTRYIQKLYEQSEHLSLLSLEKQATALQDTSSWLELSCFIDDVMIKILLTPPFFSLETTEFRMKRAICTPDSCPTGATQGQVDNILIAAATADIATAIAQGVAAAIPQEILGTANPAYSIALVIATALDVVAKGLTLSAVILQKEVNEINACQETAFQKVVYSMCSTINETKASLDNLHNKIDLIDTKINILVSLAAELKALIEEILLRQIEENLATCHPLISLYLPAEMGGRLETVEALLQSLIRLSTSAGNITGMAESYRKQGLAAALNNEYCKALQWFIRAYKQLTMNACCPCLELPISKNTKHCPYS